MKTFHATEFTACNKDGLFTPSQLETLAWMAEGKENSVIGMLRGHGEPGAKKLVSQVLQKLQCNNRCLAIARAFSKGYLVANTSSARALVAFLIVLSGIAAGTGAGDQLMRTASSRSNSVNRVRWEEALPANSGGVA